MGLGVDISVAKPMIERVKSEYVLRANTLCHKIPLLASLSASLGKDWITIVRRQYRKFGYRNTELYRH